MYLESLEIQGFKSFPDKIKLEFDKGLTAVVGPNGSGKSNISDAVRWVLGEQSSKTLRGSRMEDVIFAGTQLRKPVGFAAVTLNIAGVRETMEIASDQISVTRKLYRSGESEYLINGAQVRLKDIYELFMDTGLGRDGYSIIGQGRVAEIISAKSNERREIFEEAAGISKFRYKKEESERRLAAAEDNILRLKDILSELESRVEPLRIQSEKAAKFIEYSDKKKKLEITLWVKRLDDLKLRLEKLTDDALISSNEYNGVSADITRLEEEQQELFDLTQGVSLTIEEYRDKILETERNGQKIHSDIAVFENDIKHCLDDIDEINKRRELSERSDIENLNAIKQKELEIQKTDEESAACAGEYAGISEALTEAAEQQRLIGGDYEGGAEALNKLYIKKSELNVSISAYENNIGEAKAALSDSAGLEEELILKSEALRQRKKEYEDTLRTVNESSDDLNNRLAGLLKLHGGRAEKYQLAAKELDDVSFRIRDKEQRIRILKDLENSMEGFSGAVKQVLKAGKSGQVSGIFGVTAQLIKVEGKYSIAIETALGAAMQNIVVKNEESAKRGIKFLQEQRAGRATFLPVSVIRGTRLDVRGLDDIPGYVGLAVDLVSFDPAYSSVFTSLLGRVAVAEDIDSAAVIAKKHGFKFKIVTLDGQVINAGGSFTGGSASKTSGVFTRKNEIEALTAEREKLSERLSVLKKSCEDLKAHKDKLEFDVAAAKEDLNVLASDKIRFETELKHVIDLIEANKGQQKSHSASKSALGSKLEELEAVSAKSKAVLSECEEEILNAEKLLSENAEKRDAAHKKYSCLSERLSALKIREAELNKDKDRILGEIEKLKEAGGAIKESFAALAESLEEKKRQIAENEAGIAALKETAEKSSEEISGINAKIAECQSNRNDLERRSNEGRLKIRDLSDQKEKLSAEVTRLEERKDAAQNDYDKIISDMSEQYNIYLSEALTIADPACDPVPIQRELTEIKRKIRDLGNVNVAAIEEYKEVYERYSFMSEQLSDVLKSKRELERLIEELTDNMRRRFSESFDIINENFIGIFSELFGGGKAELRLADPENVLETGIDINVAPPGKVIKSLSLLSGGEQSFVAIAIYFAILKFKPAPFCILDEIEAALDDINVVKYAQYLRRFTDTTQFILVTHRRGTMDEADILYGVTMQEKGVSRLLKLAHPKDILVDEIQAV